LSAIDKTVPQNAFYWSYILPQCYFNRTSNPPDRPAAPSQNI